MSAAKPNVEAASVEDRIIDAALSLAAERDWARVSLADIAEAAGLGLSAVHLHFPSRQAIVSAFLDRVDGAVLAGCDPDDAAEPVRDRLMDILMRRFDRLQLHRAGVLSILKAQMRDPLAVLCLLPRAGRGAAWLLEGAGISSQGLMGRLRTKGLLAVLAFATRAWMEDDSADMAATMAALDRALGRAHWAESRLEKICRLQSRWSPAPQGSKVPPSGTEPSEPLSDPM